MSQLSEEFRGLFPAVITPFTAEGDVNEEAFRRVLEFNIQGGVNGFWVCGGTGESVLLEPDEVTRMAEIAVDQVRGRAKLIIHVGAITTRKATDLAKRVHRTGADAICAVPPFFYRTTRQAIVDHYRTVADAGDLPFFLYNLPDATGVEITPDLMEEIIEEVPQVVGLKHSAPNFFYTRSFVNMGLITFIGHSGLLLPALVMGAAGCVDGAPGVAPEVYVDVYKSFIKGDIDRAQIKMKQAAAITAFCARTTFISVFKTILSARLGIDCGQPRLPLPSLTEEEKEAVLDQCVEWGMLKGVAQRA